jgi:hypothetical protein
MISTNLNTKVCDLSFLPIIYDQLSLTGSILEFGTFTGKSSMYLASAMPSKTIYTIDHFLGLEQTKKAPAADWVEGAFALVKEDYLNNPDVPKTVEELKAKIGIYSNITLIESDIHKLNHPDTYGLGKIGMVNIDVDIYEPTVSSLEFVSRCDWDTIFIRFDDWHGNEPEFDEHERLAFAEWILKYGYKYHITQGGYVGGVIVLK